MEISFWVVFLVKSGTKSKGYDHGGQQRTFMPDGLKGKVKAEV